jgi:hypothetical protein
MEGPSPAEIQYQKDHINETHAPAVLTACIICFTLAVIAVFLRVLSRRMAAASLGKDDYMIFAALVSVDLLANHGGRKKSFSAYQNVKLTKRMSISYVLWATSLQIF